MARNRNRSAQGQGNGGARTKGGSKSRNHGAKGQGKSAAKGKGKGGVGGQWLFVPAEKPRGQMQKKGQHKGGNNSKGKGRVINWMKTPVEHGRRNGKANGKGKSRGKRDGKGNGDGKRNGKGSGKSKNSVKPANKELDKLQELDASLKVWVGGLEEGTSWKKVRDHFKDVGKTKVALMNKGKACIAFETADEVDTAIATLNGSALGGKTLEVDVWTKTDKTDRKERKREKKGEKQVVIGKFGAKVAQKSKDKGKAVVSKFWEKLKAMDTALKVCVSNLAEDVKVKALMEHFKDLGAECAVADLMIKNKGSACIGFKSADEAESAVGKVDGSDLNGQPIVVSAWKGPGFRLDRRANKKAA